MPHSRNRPSGERGDASGQISPGRDALRGNGDSMGVQPAYHDEVESAKRAVENLSVGVNQDILGPHWLAVHKAGILREQVDFVVTAQGAGVLIKVEHIQQGEIFVVYIERVQGGMERRVPGETGRLRGLPNAQLDQSARLTVNTIGIDTIHTLVTHGQQISRGTGNHAV